MENYNVDEYCKGLLKNSPVNQKFEVRYSASTDYDRENKMAKKQKLEEELKQEILRLEEENNELKCKISELESELGICIQGTRTGEI